jgi:hypothetical protein
MAGHPDDHREEVRMTRHARMAIGAAAVLLAAGCTGAIGDPAASDDTPRDGTGTAPGAGTSPGAGTAPGTPGKPGPAGTAPNGATAAKFTCNTARTTGTPLRRLSFVQYRNTLKDLFAPVPGLDAAKAVSASLAGFPPDEPTAGFSGMDARLSDRHLETFYDVANTLASAVAGDDAKLTALAGTCWRQPSAACLDAFLDGFALRAYRRPLTTDERARYQALNDGKRDGRELFRALLLSLLMAPQFLYQMEVDGQPVSGSTGTYALGPYELASRLSYHFWQTMPDADLLKAARDGSLMTDAGFAAQVKRLFGDPRTQATVSSFYAEWYQLGVIRAFRPSMAFTNFTAGTGLQDQAAGTAFLQAAADEIVALSSQYTWKMNGTLRDFYLSDLSVTRSAALARIYGVAAWDGVSTPPALPRGERGGILTRASFLVSDNYETNPIHRGAVVRRRFLCEELPLPDPNSLPPNFMAAPPYNPNQTTRQRFEAKVLEQPCAACHALMNPIGYVLERYDSLGRFRQTEDVFDATTGKKVASLPVDSSAVPHINAGDQRGVSDGGTLTQMMADSGRAEACFARQYFRFTFHRLEDDDADGCALEGVRGALAQGKLGDALLAVAMTPGFRTRRVE